MKAILGIIAALVGIYCAMAWMNRWQPYTSENAGFTVMMRGTPSISSDFQRVGASDSVTITNYVSTPNMFFSSAPTFYVSIGTYDHWTGGENQFDIEDTYDRVTEGLAQGVQGTITSEEDVDIAGYPGRSVVVDTQLTEEMHVRFFRKDNRLYQLMVKYLKGKSPGEEAERFFNSFRLLEETDSLE